MADSESAVHKNILGLASEILTRPLAPSSLGVSLSDLGLDSLGRVELAVAVERSFDVSIPDDLLPNLDTLDDISSFVLRWTPGHRAERCTPDLSIAAGWHVTLREVTTEDLEIFYLATMSPSDLFHMRGGGTTPSRDDFSKAFWSGVACQFTVESNEDGKRVGLVSCYDYSSSGTCFIAGSSLSRYEGSGFVLEGLGLLVSYVFDRFPIRHVLAEVLGSQAHHYGQLPSDLFEPCGRLRRHSFRNGIYEDLLYFRIQREPWKLAETRWWS